MRNRAGSVSTGVVCGGFCFEAAFRGAAVSCSAKLPSSSSTRRAKRGGRSASRQASIALATWSIQSAARARTFVIQLISDRAPERDAEKQRRVFGRHPAQNSWNRSSSWFWTGFATFPQREFLAPTGVSFVR